MQKLKGTQSEVICNTKWDSKFPTKRKSDQKELQNKNKLEHKMSPERVQNVHEGTKKCRISIRGAKSP